MLAGTFRCEWIIYCDELYDIMTPTVVLSIQNLLFLYWISNLCIHVQLQYKLSHGVERYQLTFLYSCFEWLIIDAEM